MSECAACHSRTKPARRSVSEWAVTANFKHTTHGTDPRSKKPTNCLECHSTIAAAKDLASVTAPKMAQCDGCHDGKVSFKTTGFGCARCHAPPTPAGAQQAMQAGGLGLGVLPSEARPEVEEGVLLHRIASVASRIPGAGE
jgi:c(7)-type cytochrome triheme protein